MRTVWLVSLITLVSCTSKPDGDSAPGETAPPDDTAPAETGETGDTEDTAPAETGETGPDDTGDTQETGETGETGAPDVPAYDYTVGIEAIDRDPVDYAWAGYTMDVFEVNSDFEQPFTSADGYAPRFRVFWPESPDPKAEYPVLLYLHGGNADYETKDDPEGESGRCSLAYGISVSKSASDDSAIIHEAIQRGWIVILPENSWGDGFVGLGPDDPVDTKHAGMLLIETGMGWLRWGQDHLTIDPDRVYGAGSSLGALSIVYYAATHPGDLQAIVPDSGPPDMIRYYYEEEYSSYALNTLQERYSHICGGPPYDDEDAKTYSAVWPCHRDNGLINAAEADRLDLPIFHVFNGTDPISGTNQHSDVPGRVGPIIEGAGHRWASWDTDHDDPPHIQIRALSAYYAAWASVEFLAGADVDFLEAEDHAVQGGAAGDDQASGGQVLRLAGDSSGAMFSGAFAEAPPAGSSVTAAFFVSMQQVPDGGATARLLEGGVEIGSVSFAPADLPSGDDYPSRRDARAAATVTAVAGGGAITAELSSAGGADVVADLVVMSWQ